MMTRTDQKCVGGRGIDMRGLFRVTATDAAAGSRSGSRRRRSALYFAVGSLPTTTTANASIIRFGLCLFPSFNQTHQRPLRLCRQSHDPFNILLSTCQIFMSDGPIQQSCHGRMLAIFRPDMRRILDGWIQTTNTLPSTTTTATGTG